MDMQPDFVTRSEYEQFVKVYEIRHSELRLEIKELETDIRGSVNLMTTKMDALSNQVASKSLDAWKLIAASLISLIGGYVLYYAQHLFMH